jgi:hypothetical protein
MHIADVCSLTPLEPALGPKYAKDIRFREIINVNCDTHKKDIKHYGKMQSIQKLTADGTAYINVLIYRV